MKLVTYEENGRQLVGGLNTETECVYELRTPEDVSVRSMSELIRTHVSADTPPLEFVSGTERLLNEVKILAPLQEVPRDIMCVGKNYRDHSAEFSASGFDATDAGSVYPEHPIVFTKPGSTIIGPGDGIEPHSQITQSLDYEAEVGVIIGYRGRNISPDSAWHHVWGYTLINDVTARDMQYRHKQWYLGKSLDTFCPMGPVVVTSDELDGSAIDLQCYVNGELRQSTNTRDLIFDIPTLISVISSGRELKPGDVIATGTPAGVGIGFDPPRFLNSGDTVTITSPQIGTLQNQVL
ncbi:fumarylacetoacetate hydrolase family protein [Nesterenkonia muleiensis]|uniref:fumarylacetoacetate hydrolase family protein n=1 Tax=Nesterenkonia muleiensis TaxID=2282648 RepID=UPI000E727771|nr:fumarylacetoacetate hydrolase family protein [Nesterenkonia muleiensis]